MATVDLKRFLGCSVEAIEPGQKFGPIGILNKLDDSRIVLCRSEDLSGFILALTLKVKDLDGSDTRTYANWGVASNFPITLECSIARPCRLKVAMRPSALYVGDAIEVDNCPAPVLAVNKKQRVIQIETQVLLSGRLEKVSTRIPWPNTVIVLVELDSPKK